MNTRNKTWLDFIIVGAQKSGTTTLFKHLIEHPAIYMPSEKEAPFFSRDEDYEKGWNWFLRGSFANAPQDKLWGKASPQYMCYPKVPERLAKQLPQVKLIAILRAPIARAYSHYKMGVRRGYETRSFEECVQMQLAPDALAESRLNPSRTNSYIVWGEYGRMLSVYSHYFPQDQMLLLFTADLEHNPKELMTRIYRFLCVEVLLPSNLGQRFHQGGRRQRIPIAAKIARVMPVRTARALLPIGLRRRLAYWHFTFEQWNTIPDKSNEIPLTPRTLRALQKHYEADAAVLERIMQCPMPWLPFSGSRES
jgi:hypothetical protein